ncbi:MAG: 3-deoxy-D-manno-octulosonic acid transferase, partial [Betaproteobacteria bacterium]|nr:3-deoxy-D-manno-octulosonic acid transferase [Betaproteobacteria bacterium]
RTARIPAFLVNARLSEKSFRNYRRVTPVRVLIGETLTTLTGVAAQHARDAERLRSLGASAPTITGSVKFDVQINDELVALGQSWRNTLSAPRGVMLAVSTRDGEERAIAGAYSATFSKEERARQLLVVVPRHPPRFGDAADLITAAGLTMQRRSSGKPIDASTEVWLGDSMGEVAAYVAMCDFAFVGGSLLPLGGQNLIEVCAQGKPVLMGPSTYNFADAARLAREAGALVAVADADDLMYAAKTLFSDAATLERRAGAAREFSLAHRGATQKTLALLRSTLDEG